MLLLIYQISSSMQGRESFVFMDDAIFNLMPFELSPYSRFFPVRDRLQMEEENIIERFIENEKHTKAFNHCYFNRKLRTEHRVDAHIQRREREATSDSLRLHDDH